MAEPDPVSAGDLEVADRIARAVRRGAPADRRPRVEQLLAAFGEHEPTRDARRRVARAMALAGVATLPGLLEAAPGQRVVLEVREPRRRRSLRFGLLALVVVLGGAAALASTLDTSSTERAADLPSRPDTQASGEPPTTTGATTTDTTTTDTDTTTQPTATTPAEPSAAERRRQRRARERVARQRRARERRARALVAARRRVTVRLIASQATFLCVDGDGRELFNGTLSGARSFRAKVIRLNVGLGPTTRVTANGRTVPLTGSPTGVEITPKRRTFLPLGARPCA
jgi:hypothetical protein